jgi:hypothetical protein
VTVSTSGSSSSLSLFGLRTHSRSGVLAIVISPLSFGILFIWTRSYRIRKNAIFSVAVLFILLCTSCGGGSSSGGRGGGGQSGTPRGTYDLTVSGTTSGVSHTTTVTLVVQ